MKNLFIIISVCSTLLCAGCKGMFEPEIENIQNLQERYEPENARFPYALILNAYNRIPTNSWSFNDVATDDAVSNDIENAFLKAAQGQWAANNNPLERWSGSFAAIQYLNILLGEIEKVNWAEDQVVSEQYARRVRGEALGLRGMFYYYLLQAHGGQTNDGQFLGVPIITTPQIVSDNFNLPRATFQECMQQIYSDLNQSIVLLPVDYKNETNANLIDPKFGNVTREQYNRVYGDEMKGLFSGRVAMSIKSKAALLAASPAFGAGNSTTWEDAAKFTATVLNLNNGISGLAANGLTWYTNVNEIAAMTEGGNPPEIVWRNNYSEANDLERSNFPPTLNGQGRINPTQNLVDAFPMANGYPIKHSSSTYLETDPYASRDPRLATYIIINGGKAGVNETEINTTANGSTNDALNKVETSTRTGYYLKKLLRQDVNLSTGTVTTKRHYKPHIRYTELYLNYAEAANEAWGPTNNGGQAYSAYDVIKAIRARAGVGTANNDAYLESIKTNKEEMRILIRNERRLELCFEGFRFWDLRRWNNTSDETAKGVSITNNIYTFINVETRVFKDYMIYGPVPYSETLKFNALIQNKGW